MVRVVQNLCPPSRYYLKCPFSRTPQFYVVHNTANDASAANEVAYMVNNDYEVSYHFAVDDKEIVQGLPLDRNAWASGDGRGRGNMYGIHIEICYSLSGGQRFTAAEKNAAEYIATGLKERGWEIDRVMKHQDFDGKYCPHRTLDLGWQRFLNLIKSYLNEKSKEEEDMTEAQTRKLAKEIAQEEIKKFFDSLRAKDVTWEQAAVDYCKAAGLMVGDKSGDFDPKMFITRGEVAQVEYNRARREGRV